jgi:phage pi2 protein 07
MEDLRTTMRSYRQLDDAIRELNKQVGPLREQRKIKELHLGDILKNPEFQAFNVLKVEDDGSTIKVQRPNTWYKGWSLSKRDLQNYIDHYFENAGQHANRADCFTFIVEQQKRDSLAEDFKITRVVQGGENSD